VVEIKAGTPRTTLRLALDYEGEGVTTVVPYNEEISSTYSPIGGGSDEVIIAGKRLRLPFTSDPSRVEELGCSSCEGLLGVGASSPLWVVWKEVTFGSGAISLGDLAYELRDAERFNRMEIRTQKKNAIACDVGFPGLCRTEALVGPNKEPNTVIFSFESSRTLVPPTVYDAYTSGLNIFDNGRDEWPDLGFEFTVLTNDSKDGSLHARIRNHDIVASTQKGTPELLIFPQTDYPNTTFIGRPAWRSFFVFKDWVTNEARVFNWKVEKEFTHYGRFILAVSGLVFMWWKGTETGEWAIKWRFRAFRITASVVLCVFTFATIWIDSTRSALLGFTLMDIYLQMFSYLLMFFLACCILVHLMMWQGYSRQTRWIYDAFLGLTHTEEEAIALEIRAFRHRQAEAAMVPLAIPEYSPSSGQYYYAVRSPVPMGPQHFYASTERQNLPSGEGIYAYFADPFHSVTNPSPPCYNDQDFHSMIGSQRLWCVISFSFETLLLFTTFMVWSTVREDTLAGFGSLMLFSYLIVNSTYHLIAQMYHRNGWHNALWYLFMLIQLIFVLTTYAVAIYFIFYPFSLRFVPDYGHTPIVITTLFSLVLFYFAEHLAATRVPTLYYL